MKWYALILAVVCCAGGTARAALDVKLGDKVKLSDGPGDTGGGIFRVDVRPYSSPLANEFETFCVELTETISFGTEYTVTAISDRNSSANAGTGLGILTSKSAWSYLNFRQGLLSTAISSPSGGVVEPREVGNALQELIWGELKYVRPPVAAGSDESKLLTKWAADFAGSGFSGIGSVRIMQLKDAAGANRQDQLILIPEPAALTVWGGLSLLGLATIRRRGSKA